MRAQGIDVRLNARCVRVDDRGITLGDGELLTAGTVICTIGTAPNPLIAAAAAPEESRAARSRFRYVRARRRGSLGDRAIARPCRTRATARSLRPRRSSRSGRRGSSQANIASKVAGEPTRAFTYRPMGQLSAIGHNKAVAEVLGIKLCRLRRLADVARRVPAEDSDVGRKVRLFLEWNWAMFFPPDISHLGYARTRRVAPAADDSGERRAAA